MRAIAAGLTDIGRERNHNEDRYILLPEFNVFVVADGMGGHQSGEVASRMAASTIASYFRAAAAPNGAAAERLRAAVCDANAKIFARADDSRAHRGMGTTVVAAAYNAADGAMHVVHAGDSRAYHVRGDKIKQLTRDHSLLSDALLERPELTESDLAYLPKNVITRALGIAPTVEVDVTTIPTEIGDVFLLCSDGLHGLVEDDEIMRIVHSTDVLTDACTRLVDAANKAGGKDNITAVLIRIEEEPEPWSRRNPGARVARGAASGPSGSVPPAANNGAGLHGPEPEPPPAAEPEPEPPPAAEAEPTPAVDAEPSPPAAPARKSTKGKKKRPPS